MGFSGFSDFKLGPGTLAVGMAAGAVINVKCQKMGKIQSSVQSVYLALPKTEK